MSRRIAVMGLGQMGWPIARNLARKGNGTETFLAVDADPARVAGLSEPGITVTADRSAVAGAEVLILCLPDGDVVESVLFGPDGLGSRLAPGRSWSISAPSRTARRWRSAGRWNRGDSPSSTRRSPARPPGPRPGRSR